MQLLLKCWWQLSEFWERETRRRVSKHIFVAWDEEGMDDELVVGVKGDGLLGPFVPQKNGCYDDWVHFTDGEGRNKRWEFRWSLRTTSRRGSHQSRQKGLWMSSGLVMRLS